MEEKRATYAAPREKKRKWGLIAAAVAIASIIAIGAFIAVYFIVIKPKGNKSGSGGGTSAGASSANPTSTGTPKANLAVTGGDGTMVTTDAGNTFTYKNSFGGSWYWDENDPFHNGAQANSWTPPLNQTFQFGVNKIYGVNIGGWLNTEPFITPAIYQKYSNGNPPAVDEWTLSQAMRADAAGGGINQLEDHYKTFITEEDFAQIAGAGLNFVRIPIPYWAIETRGDEPFLAKTCWTYFLKAVQWARKYGIRINLDLHALPGSQNGWNHSGRLGTVNMLNGPMGYANAQRSLDYIRILAEFISQPEYKDVIVMFGITNEPQGSTVGMDALQRYYLQAYNIVRNAGGTGSGSGPFISFHDAFFPQSQWAGFLPGADRIALDSHPYIAFGGQSNNPVSSFAQTPCNTWAANMNQSMGAFGLSAAGEFSNAIDDCGLFVNGVGLGTRFEGDYVGGGFPKVGDCSTIVDYQNWDAPTKQGYMNFALSSMDALQNWFFWTWKIGNSTAGVVESPQWSYQLGLQNGWMPTDPRQSTGKCGGQSPWNGPLQAYQTGGQGAGQIPASVTQALAWPPPTISNGGPINQLPSYTPTASLVTLPVPTYTVSSGKATTTVNAGSGWQNTADNAGMMTDIAGCSYLDPWVGQAALPPACTPAAKRDAIPEPMLTAVPPL
ncbi:glycoside hydrolase family 5 protein [Rickenella mellea]|uniref:glucan 1,3-beta-glucosidase n=1 Tax=Rickenella mellea TaxID=50990 RepID=A0A4Y7QIQ3_9AGAM|nr:glycoside hydrolase family 5 protein [Rickenella mellea]